MSGPVQKSNPGQRIRGPGLEVFRKDVTFDEAVRIADSENRVIASNKRIDQTLIGSEEHKKLEFLCWTGTLLAFSEYGKPLGKQIEYIDSKTKHRWIFPVPDDLQGKTDCVLVTEHPHYKIEIDRNDLIIHVSYLTPLEMFPKEDGGYRADPRHCIPLGEKTGPDDPDIRYLERSWNEPMVVPIARGDAASQKKFIYLNSPSFCKHLIVEAPAEEQKEAGSAPAKGEAKKDGAEQKEMTISDLMTEMLGSLRNSIAGGFAYSPAEMKRKVIDMIKVMMVFAPRSHQWSYPDYTRPFIRASNLVGEFVTKELANDPRYKDIVPELKKYYLEKLREVQK